METSLTKKIINVLHNFEDIEKFRELVAEILAERNVETDHQQNGEEIISETTLIEKTDDLKKIITAAKRMAVASGDEDVKNEDPFIDASQVDESVERLKQAALYENGVIDFKELTKRLIDRTEVRLVVLAENLIDISDEVIPRAMEKVKFLQPFAPLAKKIIPLLKPVAKKLVIGGIKKTAEFAKKTIPTLIGKAINVASKVKSKLLKIFS